MGASLMAWSAYHFGLMVVMWWVMMIGMMVPSAAPMILMFATINRRRRERDQPFVPTAVFAVGYLIAWGAFSVAATAAQWGLEEAALLSPMMVSTSPVLGGLLFVAAGVYQWTPLKHACLRNCRSPFSFIMTRWRDGRRGALGMGIEHGAYCLGCCWFIMALLFVGGVMNLLWVAAIAAFVFVEKLFPAGDRVARGAGVLMVVAGVYMLLPV
jgi:predicted metal-binding membrane protein